MYKSRKVVGILILVMVFMMMFSSVAMAAEGTLRLYIDYDTSYINQDPMESEKVFIVQDDTIVGFTDIGVEINRLILPDAIDNKSVSVGYDLLSPYRDNIIVTLDRSKTDIEAMNILERQEEDYKNKQPTRITKLVLGMMICFIYLVLFNAFPNGGSTALVGFIIIPILYLLIREPMGYFLSTLF